MATAVASALGQSVGDDVEIEVIVVDDGSTDHSLEVLAGFADRVTLLSQDNQGMAAAMNAAYERSSGELVIFLDADDFLHPDCVAAVLAAMPSTAAKAHWRLALVDADGRAFATNPAAQHALADGDAADELCRTGSYSTVPTSGNCWSRWALELVMPVPVEDFRYSGDGYLNLAIPFLGPVVAVPGTLSSYRVHDRNRSTEQGRLGNDRLQVRIDQAGVLDAWLPRIASDHGRSAPPGAVLGHPDFRLMLLIAEQASPSRRPLLSRLVDGVRLTRAAVGASSVRPRRQLLLGAIGPVLPLLPLRVVEHVRDVAFGGKAMRPRRRRP